MKKLLLFGAVFALFACGTDNTSLKEKELELKEQEKQPQTVLIGKLEIMSKDLGRMTWFEAKEACDDLGEGWRLPTLKELNIMYKNNEKIPGLLDQKVKAAIDGGYDIEYWSSDEGGKGAWCKNIANCMNGNEHYIGKAVVLFVRPVRSI